jgi:hypothetical protein
MNFLNMIKAGMDPDSIGGGLLKRMGATGIGGYEGQDAMGNRPQQQPTAAPPAYAPPGAPDMTQAGMAGGQPGGPHEMKEGGLAKFLKMMIGGGA